MSMPRTEIQTLSLRASSEADARDWWGIYYRILAGGQVIYIVIVYGSRYVPFTEAGIGGAYIIVYWLVGKSYISLRLASSNE